ncbi:mitochondrial genome maintenance [Pyrenophora seminiperda CCB06]|uniref:Mitochondrial genome maintenance protein MGM101 n=1 Tax=Pyrenophora seminiperda CCB06 TaxID=1302712 RepID=A0A3M7MAY7_9PLEO|nr:mitochondrial genome maintenance [Pyrenophora seminiperda CCB06]
MARRSSPCFGLEFKDMAVGRPDITTQLLHVPHLRRIRDASIQDWGDVNVDPGLRSEASKRNRPHLPTTRTNAVESAAQTARKQRSLTDGLSDAPPELEGVPAIDWTRSYHGLGSISFTPEQTETLLAPLTQDDVEVKPDGIIYLPEIKYRRILNKAFGPGGWGLAPRGESIVTAKVVTREYGLIVQGRLVSIARGEQQYFDPDGIPTATEGCKSNALMRCCKDLGIASELWDPRFIREFTSKMTKEVWVEHASTKKKRKIVLRKDDTAKYPYKEVKA